MVPIVLTLSPPFHMVLPGDNSYSAPHQSGNEAASEKRPEILNWQNHQRFGPWLSDSESADATRTGPGSQDLPNQTLKDG